MASRTLKKLKVLDMVENLQQMKIWKFQHNLILDMEMVFLRLNEDDNYTTPKGYKVLGRVSMDNLTLNSTDNDKLVYLMM